MNDFTKEELKTIFHWSFDRVEALGAEFFRDEHQYSLHRKVRGMIDNYCEIKIPTMADYPE